MFENVNQAYNGSDATIEIIIMLLVAFLLGFLLRYFLDSSDDDTTSTSGGGDTTRGSLASSSIPPMSTNANDLKVVEGVGPKIEELLKKEGIGTWGDLARADESKLKSILAKGGDNFKLAEPKSWPHQATLARDGKWDELKRYQDFLEGGKE